MIVALAYFKGNSKGQQEYSGSPADIAYQQAEAALNGSNGQQRNPQMAMGLWSRAFELGRIDAGLRIAKLYKQGDGLPKDPSLALYWYEKAAQKGNQEAQANAGDMYYRGTGTNKDEVKALEYFQHCAISILIVRVCGPLFWKMARPEKKDTAKSLELLRAAAAKEEINAQRWLGIAYFEGQLGLQKTLKKA
jgi:TPR repeat protein